MKYLKNKNHFGYASMAAIIASFIALIFYIVTSYTGYLAGSIASPLPIVFTILSMAILIALIFFAEKLDRRIVGGILFVVNLLLTGSLCYFILGRVDLFADVYFIPVNYPAAEKSALMISIVGFVFYILALAANIYAAFGETLNKEEK